MNDAFFVEECDQQCFDLGFLQITLFWSRGSRWRTCYRLPFWFRIELVTSDLIFRGDVFQNQWIMVTHGNEFSRSFHPFCFCSSVSLWGTNREQIFCLRKSSRTVVCAVFLLMPKSLRNQSCDSRRSCASICRTFSTISEVLLVDVRPEGCSSSVVSFPCETFELFVIFFFFFSRLPFRTPASTFHAPPLQLSPNL